MTSTTEENADLAAEITALREELTALADPRALEVNRRRGDDHAVNLGKLRAIAKRLKARPDLARALWREPAEDSAPKLLAILLSRPSQYSQDELDQMLRGAGTPKVRDWLLSNLVKKSRHKEALRVAWFDDADPAVASAGWVLTSERVLKKPEGIDQVALLEQIEAEMKAAPDPLQWAMNDTLAQIGITNPALRERARGIGERLEVLKGYPTPPNCTSPYAPVWIDEMVRRAEAG
ncbi:DNA alkylation repair protein [uncultured Brachybacterium sp.]|uniref:DNA alkylation repair protein n=1 Tax=uncultured Brachybacterium sp. TaxID=189680 RepID=UPI00261FD375|nr:DNA alkylation repair protein [uncultured Brachybacterium sp.]